MKIRHITGIMAIVLVAACRGAGEQEPAPVQEPAPPAAAPAPTMPDTMMQRMDTTGAATTTQN